MSQASDLHCSKCASPMTKGFLAQANGIPVVWIDGESELSAFSGGVKNLSKPMFKVIVYRCRQCGNLDYFAHEEL